MTPWTAERAAVVLWSAALLTSVGATAAPYHWGSLLWIWTVVLGMAAVVATANTRGFK